MRTREGAPSGKSKAPTVQNRTTQKPSTTFALRHRFSVPDEVLYHLIALPFVLAFVIAGCALLWLVAP